MADTVKIYLSGPMNGLRWQAYSPRRWQRESIGR